MTRRPTPIPYAEHKKFPVRCRVVHALFGNGTVRLYKGHSIGIDFDGHGYREMDDRFCGPNLMRLRPPTAKPSPKVPARKPRAAKRREVVGIWVFIGDDGCPQARRTRRLARMCRDYLYSGKCHNPITRTEIPARRKSSTREKHVFAAPGEGT